MLAVAVNVPLGWAQVSVRLFIDTVGATVFDCTVVVTAVLLHPLRDTVNVYVPTILVVKLC